MKFLVVILGGAFTMALLNNVVLDLTDPSLNDWISRLGYALYGASTVWAARSSRS